MSTAALPSPMCSAALIYARRGWPVFPCREVDGEPYVTRKGETRTPRAKAPYLGNGLKDATTDERTIAGWWRRWPTAMIGLPLGGPTGLFALDFDPRHDEQTGEEFTLAALKAALEEQMGVALPVSLASRTPSGGVHVFLKQPDDGGAEIRNRGNLPLHVDVRGRGGYVIAPPSACQGGAAAAAGTYRWLHGRANDEAVDAPAALVAILRAPKARQAAAPPPDNVAGDQPAAASAPRSGDAVAEAIHRYGLRALDDECRALAATPLGARDNESNAKGFIIGQLVAAGAIGEQVARSSLYAAVAAFGDPEARRRAIDNGFAAGLLQPRDLTHVADAARERAERAAERAERNRARAGGSALPPPRTPASGPEGRPSFRVEGSGANDNHGGSGADPPDEDSRHRRCIFRPHTDLGNAERFVERFGDDFRWSPALGWLGWDGRRWVALEQEEKGLPPEVTDAVFKTVRAIQDEAALIKSSGMHDPRDNASGLDDIIYLSQSKSITKAEQHRKWGRTSEANGKLTCIARLAQSFLAVKADAFDADPLTMNLENGTLRFRRRPVDDGFKGEWRLDPHRREDLITKLAPVTFDRAATCPIYDEMFAWAQPKAAMRRYLHQWGGMSMTGDMAAQILHYWYGRGGNGKSTTIDAWCAAIGDYTSTVPIETFLDQGIKKRGDQATPDLAKLGGIRLLRTSEPERGAKLAAALIKLVTGGEPMSVRFLNRGFFELRPMFKMTISGNYRPEVPDTDDGIWRRLKLIPWEMRVRDEQHPEGTRDKDLDLPKKLLGELSGIFNRLVDGLVDWLENGLVEPGEVTTATQQYRSESDPLSRFLKLCTEARPDGRVQSSHLHELFLAWCKVAGEKEWTQIGFSKAMMNKGFTKKASDGMQWLGIVATRQVSDFIDGNGQPLSFTIDDDPARPRGPPPIPLDDDDDGFPP